MKTIYDLNERWYVPESIQHMSTTRVLKIRVPMEIKGWGFFDPE